MAETNQEISIAVSRPSPRCSISKTRVTRPAGSALEGESEGDELGEHGRAVPGRGQFRKPPRAASGQPSAPLVARLGRRFGNDGEFGAKVTAGCTHTRDVRPMLFRESDGSRSS